MADAVKFMRNNAEYFADRKWLYTSDTGHLRRVVSVEDAWTWKNVKSRLKEAYDWLFHYPAFARTMDSGLPRLRRALQPLSMAWYTLTSVDDRLPDGMVGSNYTYWMEDGLYIMMMRPSVGSLVADFVEQYPDHPSAVAIRTEMEAILADFDQQQKEKREAQP